MIIVAIGIAILGVGYPPLDKATWNQNPPSILKLQSLARSNSTKNQAIPIWLGVDLTLRKMIDFVSWDDENPNFCGKS
jgi:hypothetical protein